MKKIWIIVLVVILLLYLNLWPLFQIKEYCSTTKIFDSDTNQDTLIYVVCTKERPLGGFIGIFSFTADAPVRVERSVGAFITTPLTNPKIILYDTPFVGRLFETTPIISLLKNDYITDGKKIMFYENGEIKEIGPYTYSDNLKDEIIKKLTYKEDPSISAKQYELDYSKGMIRSYGNGDLIFKIFGF